ncbi:MAG: GTP-binding protein, partial [Gammaproteobacteria bacterium]|nr:GTP-binding protein [Gammaproteobacteria bacterium]
MTDGRFGIREQVVLIGPVASGKSCLLYQIEKGEFNKQQELTYVIEHGKKDFQVETSNGRVPGRLQIWDTSGVEDHVEITSSYYSKAKVIAVCLRVSDPGWKVEADKWIQEITTTKSNAKIVFVATQSDDTTGTNYTEAMRTYANDKGYPFFVTSAKTGKYTDIDGVEKNIHNDFGNSLAREMGYTVTRNLSLESKSASAPITASPVRPRVSFDESDSFDPEAIIGFSLTGIGLVMLTFAFLTFPPFHLIPHPAVSTFLALFGS